MTDAASTYDPRNLIREAYRIEGITLADCRSIFLDWALGLKDGDVILAIDGRQPSDPAHAMRILRSYEPGERLDLEIIRQQQRQNVEVILPAAEMSAVAPKHSPDALAFGDPDVV